jgi:hypothetical protein
MEKTSFKMGCLTLCVVAAVVLAGFWINEEISCRNNGYEKFIWYRDGKRSDILTGPSSSTFPDSNFSDVSKEFLKKSILFDNYDRYLRCGEPLNHAERISIVRFSIKIPFKFIQLTKYTDASEVSSWYQVPIEGYVTSSVYRIQKRDKNDYSGASWLTVKDKTSLWTGRFELIKSFDIEWLKNESLDEAHLIGIWQGGWLFRSNKPDHYVWVN